jgi:hypothetical protein
VSETELNSVCPSVKFIDPVGVPAGEETVAVKVTGFNEKTGLSEDTSETVGLALLTINTTGVAVGTAK